MQKLNVVIVGPDKAELGRIQGLLKNAADMNILTETARAQQWTVDETRQRTFLAPLFWDNHANLSVFGDVRCAVVRPHKEVSADTAGDANLVIVTHPSIPFAAKAGQQVIRYRAAGDEDFFKLNSSHSVSVQGDLGLLRATADLAERLKTGAALA